MNTLSIVLERILDKSCSLFCNPEVVKFLWGQGGLFYSPLLCCILVEFTVYEGYLIPRIPTLRQQLPYKDKGLVDINVNWAVWVIVIFGSYLRLRVLVVN